MIDPRYDVGEVQKKINIKKYFNIINVFYLTEKKNIYLM
jgi:hypothetical protein